MQNFLVGYRASGYAFFPVKGLIWLALGMFAVQGAREVL